MQKNALFGSCVPLPVFKLPCLVRGCYKMGGLRLLAQIRFVYPVCPVDCRFWYLNFLFRHTILSSPLLSSFHGNNVQQV